MTSLRYPSISSGYIGFKCEAATLNSQFYSIFLAELKSGRIDMSSFLHLPQRIPRAGFFEELCDNETSEFTEHFTDVTYYITQQQKNAHELFKSNSSPLNIRSLINWSNLLVRYGQLDIISYQNMDSYHGPYVLELKILKETNSIEKQLSDGYLPNLTQLLSLYRTYNLTNEFVTAREMVMLLNRIIVYHYRYKAQDVDNITIREVSNHLLTLLETFNDNCFTNMIYSSVAYRGLAMASDLGDEKQNELLMMAEKLAREVTGNTPLEKIIVIENLYTCLQSQYKWAHNKKVDTANKYILELISLDPYDSTGHSELGLHFFSFNLPEEAATRFKLALDLGPPGTALNAYYYAKCLEQLNRHQEASEYLHKSANLDKQAISPWLDLLDYYTKINNKDQINNICNHILSTTVLCEQLEADELKNIQNYS